MSERTMSMTHKERFLRYMRHEPVDRFPVWVGGPRESTLEAWKKQGLTPELLENFVEFIGIDPSRTGRFIDTRLPAPKGVAHHDTGMRPRFEERTIEVVGSKKIWIDDMGVKRLDKVRQDTPGFVTRSYLEFPVRDRDSWLEMRKRYDPNDPARILPLDGGASSPRYYENKKEDFAQSVVPEWAKVTGF